MYAGKKAGMLMCRCNPSACLERQLSSLEGYITVVLNTACCVEIIEQPISVKLHATGIRDLENGRKPLIRLRKSQ